MPNVLSSWKEIALFMGKGVRTVQRWERQLALPVHRPNASLRNVVFADPDELTKWMSGDSSPFTDQPTTALLLGNDMELRNDVRCGLEDAGYVVLRCVAATETKFLTRVCPKVDLLLIGNDVDDACVTLALGIVAARPRTQILVADGSSVSEKFSSKCIRVPRPLTTEALLRAVHDHKSSQSALADAA